MSHNKLKNNNELSDDKQPQKENSTQVQNEFETCYVDNDIDYNNECVVKDEGCILSEELSEDSNSESTVPEGDSNIKPGSEKSTKHPNSWPTLEILPGGVIKHGDKCDTSYPDTDIDLDVNVEMMYACAKCSQSFKYLFCLVKHVKWHEDQEKIPVLSKLRPKNSKNCLLPKKKIKKDRSRKISKKS